MRSPALAWMAGALVIASVGGAACDGQPLRSSDGGQDSRASDGLTRDVPALDLGATDTPATDLSDAGDVQGPDTGDGGQPPNPDLCYYDGLVYTSGSMFLSKDGCNACQCAFGSQVTCQTKTCPVAGVTCTVDGRTYPAGAPIPIQRTDCDACACTSTGEVACTDRRCAGGQCVVGFDDTCNEDPTVRTPRGSCQPGATCACGANPVNPGTGHCLAPGHDVQSGCELGGAIHPDGSSFPCADGCNTCGCDKRAVYAKTYMTCGAPPCALDDALIFEYVTDFDSQKHRVTLTPGSASAPDVGYVHTRTDPSGATASCSPALPACGDPERMNISLIATDLRDPVVQELLAQKSAQPIVLGDGPPQLSVRRGTGQGIAIGSGCDGRTRACNAVPPGVERLAGDLRELDSQVIEKSRSCEVLAAPTFECGAIRCDSRTQYCARVDLNGVDALHACRPYPTGCDSCGCARDDAIPFLRQSYPCDQFSTRCSGSGRSLDPEDVSATLVIGCFSG